MHLISRFFPQIASHLSIHEIVDNADSHRQCSVVHYILFLKKYELWNQPWIMSNYPKHHQQRRPGSGKSRPPAPPPPPPPSRTRPFPNNATPNGRMCHESQGATPSSASQPQSGVNNRYSNGNTYEVYQIHQPLGIPYPVTSRHGCVLHQFHEKM